MKNLINILMNDKYEKTATAAAAVLIIIFFASCGVSELSAPTGLTAEDADKDNPSSISLSWLPVEDADIYYVYRSGTEDSGFELVGHSVTSSEVDTGDGSEQLRYLFIESLEDDESGTWWYRVTAASDADISAESAMSTAVEARTYENTWSDAKDLGAAAQIMLAADTETLYALYCAAAGTDAISVQSYAVDPTAADDEASDDDTSDDDTSTDAASYIWTPFAESPGNTDGGAYGPFNAFVSNSELYVLFNDQDFSTVGAATMKYYHNSDSDEAPSYAWETLGDAGFSSSAAVSVSAASVGFNETLYAGFLEGTAGTLWKYLSADESWHEMNLTDDSVSTTTSLQLIDNNDLYIGYEDTSTTGLYLRAYDDAEESLQAVNTATTVTTDAIDDGNAVFVSGGGDLYAVYLTDGDVFEAERLVDNVWTPLTGTDGKPAASAAVSEYGTLDAVWFNSRLYVFYVDASGYGRVKYYNDVEGEEGWETAENNGGAVTGSGVTKVSLASSGTAIYAGYVEGANAYVRIFE